jgi:ABC-type dipeptide/oligopeptide/nickel transport system permease component
MSVSPKTANPVQKHKREVLLWILLPVLLPAVVLVILCVVLGIGSAAGTIQNDQITVIMSIVATLFIAIPMTLLCLIPCLLLVVTAYFSGRAYAHARTPLRAARRLSGQIAQTTSKQAPRFARPLIGLNARLTRWEHTLRSWQQTEALPAQEEKNDE